MSRIGAIGLTMLWVSGIILMRRAQKGDMAAAARIQTVGKLTGPLAIIAIIFAVITFG